MRSSAISLISRDYTKRRTLDNDIDVDGTAIALHVSLYKFCDRSVLSRLKESPIATRGKLTKVSFFFREGKAERERANVCILSCKSKGTIRYIAKRLCSLRRVSLTVDAFGLSCFVCSMFCEHGVRDCGI